MRQTMALKVCAESGCPELVDKGYCTAHTKANDRARGSRQQRGYDAAHVRLRASWARKVATGQVMCWRCHSRISPLEPWDLGHVDTDDLPRAQQRRLPECLPCNRATSSR